MEMCTGCEEMFSTAADSGETDRLLQTFDYDELPTFPLRPSYRDCKDKGDLATHILTFKASISEHDEYNASSVPIYQTATFQQPCIERFGAYDYSRSGNPTRTAVEELVASLEGAYAAFAFGTGMSAILTCLHLLQHGDTVLVADDIYGGTYRLLTKVISRLGISTKFVNLNDAKGVECLLKEDSEKKVKMIYLETPSNPLMRIFDIRELSKLAREHNALLVVDSTMMTPVLMKPLCLGAHLVVHSATKFLSGHADVMAGFVCCANEDLAKQIAFMQNAEGTALGPFDCWLILRGLKTLPLRLERCQSNALKVAEFLQKHPLVTCVYYAGFVWGLSCEGQFKLHTSQAKGGGSIVSFRTNSVLLSRYVCDFCKLFKITVSFGSVNSLIEMPCVLSHASIPADCRTIPGDLIRLSIGIENIDDILGDLAQAFQSALQAYQQRCKNGSS